MNELCILIMAAGKGTRMVSSRAKVLHRVCGIPMLTMIYRAASSLRPEGIFVIVGNDAERVRDSLKETSAHFIHQTEQLGTGHALMCAETELARMQGDVLVMFGDTPRIRVQTLQDLVEDHRRSGADTTLLTAVAPDPFAYGRILRSADGQISGIVEEKDATPEQRQIREINPGFYCFKIKPLIESLGKLSNHNAQGEFYLTDLIAIQRREGRRIHANLHGDFEELCGINSRRELAETSLAMSRDKNLALMASGVTLIDPGRTYIELDVVVEPDVIIYPMVTLEGATRIGAESVVRSGSRIAGASLGRGVQVLDSTLITDSHIGDNSIVGPHAHVRDRSHVGADCRIGNFVELARSSLGDGVRAAHLASLGDAKIGRAVNIGAGVITCNYDGVQKQTTIIEEAAFVGSDCQLIAPVRIGRGAYVAAGSCITRDIPPGALGIARSRQAIKTKWAGRSSRSARGTID
jgi:bifunctional UDP-N-acetylglucosamine pyrophosphorylase/glucosamine-1-phosphate N-acetyltransferase